MKKVLVGAFIAALVALAGTAAPALAVDRVDLVNNVDGARAGAGAAAATVSDAPAAETSALEMLDTLAEKGRAPKTGYDRVGKFGSRGKDVDRNGCDTRNDVLQRDLTEIVLSGKGKGKGSCKVMSGTLSDQYTGTEIDFVRGNQTSSLVQIDHVVALSDAWQKGAQALTQEQRVMLANDPLNLIAVDGASNSAKGAGDAATWLPKNKSFRCEYVARQVSVKAAYNLWVTKAEKAAIARVLTACPDQPAYVSELVAGTVSNAPLDAVEPAVEPATAPAPLVEPAPAPAPEPAPAPAPAEAYYKNCTAAREAGAAPVYAGQPGYARHLDRDGDGVGCE